jgi:hypothetical protein
MRYPHEKLGFFAYTHVNTATTQGNLTNLSRYWMAGMQEVLRTNNPVLLSYVEALLKECGCEMLIADQNLSVMDGSIGVLPRRVLVADDHVTEARRVLRDAGLDKELKAERETGRQLPGGLPVPGSS